MILSPIRGNVRITQRFGERPEFYGKWKLKGHEGLDCGGSKPDNPVDENIYAPFQGIARVENKGPYGLHVKIRDGEKECYLAHLESVAIENGQKVYSGTLVGKMGTTSYPTPVAKHLHYCLRRLNDDNPDIWLRSVKDHGNGFFGWFDPAPVTIKWGGETL